jgi:uncharacterized phiE125 gp8 family phage protein
MSIVVITPPAPILTLEEAKTWCGVEHSDHDVLLDDLIAAASAEIEPPNSWIGCAFGLQTLEQRLDGCYAWRCGLDLTVRCPPLRTLVSIEYDDLDGVAQTLAPDRYRVTGVGSTAGARVSRAFGQHWPALRSHDEGVRIRFTAGYELDDPPLAQAKQALRLMVGFMYLNREASAADALAGTAERLLASYRVYI